MSTLYHVLFDKIQHRHTKTSDLPTLVSTAESLSNQTHQLIDKRKDQQ